MYLLEMFQLTLYDVVGHTLQGLGDVGEEARFLTLIEQVEERPRLNAVIVAFTVDRIEFSIDRFGEYGLSTHGPSRHHGA
jgi:hypothetical protein